MAAVTIVTHRHRRWFDRGRSGPQADKNYLTDLDAAIGDADHGTNMARGFAAVAEKPPSGARRDMGAIFKLGRHDPHVHGRRRQRHVVRQLLSERSGHRQAARELTPAELSGSAGGLGGHRPAGAGRGRRQDDGRRLVAGGGGPGCRPGVGKTSPRPCTPARLPPNRGCRHTIPLQAKKGRASYLGERSIGHRTQALPHHLLLLLVQAVDPENRSS